MAISERGSTRRRDLGPSPLLVEYVVYEDQINSTHY